MSRRASASQRPRPERHAAPRSSCAAGLGAASTRSRGAPPEQPVHDTVPPTPPPAPGSTSGRNRAFTSRGAAPKARRVASVDAPVVHSSEPWNAAGSEVNQKPAVRPGRADAFDSHRPSAKLTMELLFRSVLCIAELTRLTALSSRHDTLFMLSRALSAGHWRQQAGAFFSSAL